MPYELVESGEQQLYVARDGTSDLGYIAVDSRVGGRTRGGLRITQDLSVAELQDAARSMTLKYGYLGLPQGGSKAGIRGDGEAPVHEKRILLSRFANAIEPLLRQRTYIPDSDLGTTGDDIQAMMRGIGVSINRREWRTRLSGRYTAASCLAAIDTILERRGRSLSGARIAIQGFGNVGRPLAQLLDRRGARIVAISTSHGAVQDPQGLDVAQMLHLAAIHGSAFIQRASPALALEGEQLLEIPSDVLCPCARRHAIHDRNVDCITAPVVCAGANNPATNTAAQRLLDRGVVFPPDFVSNCGGVLGGTLEFAGLRPHRVESLIENLLKPKVTSLLVAAERPGGNLWDLAETEAFSRHERVQQAVLRPGPRRRLLDSCLEAYRRGWLPPALVARFAVGHIERRLRG